MITPIAAKEPPCLRERLWVPIWQGLNTENTNLLIALEAPPSDAPTTYHAILHTIHNSFQIPWSVVTRQPADETGYTLHTAILRDNYQDFRTKEDVMKDTFGSSQILGSLDRQPNGMKAPAGFRTQCEATIDLRDAS